MRQKLKEVDDEIAGGRAWRAKEILQGLVGTEFYGHQPEVLEAYGQLLDNLADRYTAGMYLFLSGSDSPEHQEAIELYLQRNSKRSAAGMVAQFPSAVRHHGLGNLPETVRDVLREKGFDPDELIRREPRAASLQEPEHWKTRIYFLGCFLVVLVVAGIFATGLITVVSTFASWLW